MFVSKRPAANAKVTIATARPGIVIGKKGEDIEVLRKELTKMMGVPVQINIEEVRKPELDAALVQSIAGQLERRVMFRRAMKRAVQNAMRLGAEGIRVQVGGRLGGAEIARTSITAKVVCRCTHCVRISITRLLKPQPLTASSVSKFGSSKAKYWAAFKPFAIRLLQPSVVTPRRRTQGDKQRCCYQSV